MKPVLCLGLTPALQRSLVFDRLTVNTVNRTQQVTITAAGKAINTAHALVTLGTPAAVTGLNGGTSGKTVAALVRSWSVINRMTAMRATTRICTTLIDIDKETVTELVEEAPDPGPTALRRFITDALQLIPKTACLVISGTLPPFAPDTYYVRFAQAAAKAHIPLIIDSHRSALINVLFEKPLLAKLNVNELALTLDEPMNTEKRILRGMQDLLNMGAQNVCVTRGGKTAYLAGEQGNWKITPPAILSCVNPIGSGDCATAGIVHALLKGRSLPDAVRYGVACGSANAETGTPAAISPARITSLLRETQAIRSKAS